MSVYCITGHYTGILYPFSLHSVVPIMELNRWHNAGVKEHALDYKKRKKKKKPKLKF